MNYQNLQLDEADGILLVTVNRPRALNALNTRTMDELDHLFSVDAPGRGQLRGIILTGAGDRAFVAGADISEFLDLDPEAGAAFARRGQAIFRRIERYERPVVAAVNGFALGGGCELAMACHLRVAGARARFGQPEVKLGIIPGYGGTQRLTQLIGKGKALELILTADLVGAEEARQLGLVNQVVEPGQEVAAARKLIGKIAAHGPVAVAQAIRAVQAGLDIGVDGYAREVEAFGACTGTEDFREGATAFLEKREPDFQGK